MENTANNTPGGVGIFTTFQVVFLTLKLAGLVSWPWVWVMAPLWIEITLWVLAKAILATLYVMKEGDK